MTFACDCETPLADHAAAVAHLTATRHRVVMVDGDAYQVLLEDLARRAGTSDVGAFEVSTFAQPET